MLSWGILAEGALISPFQRRGTGAMRPRKNAESHRARAGGGLREDRLPRLYPHVHAAFLVAA